MRKILAAIFAVTILVVSMPVSSFAGKKEKKEKTEKTEKSRKQKRKDKRQQKKWDKVSRRSNHYRFPRDKHVGENMFSKQTPKEQKRRSKHHLKP